jgi:hypothetical protein
MHHDLHTAHLTGIYLRPLACLVYDLPRPPSLHPLSDGSPMYTQMHRLEQSSTEASNAETPTPCTCTGGHGIEW